MPSSNLPILITGASGQVGSAIVSALAGRQDILTPHHGELDLTSSDSIRTYMRKKEPHSVINAAAYTAVDKAESEPELAHAVNALAPGVLGEEARRLGGHVLHLSTDYVFSGELDRPYVETDATGPKSVYGRTKLEGEQALAATGAPFMILRTSWVYAATGKNFLLTILRLADERPELKIVADQQGAPTSAADLARLTLHLLEQGCGGGGVYHATGAGETTWHGFAAEIVRLRQKQQPDLPLATVLPIPTSAYPTPAQRPANSRLDCSRLAHDFGFRFPDWRDSLAETMAQLP